MATCIPTRVRQGMAHHIVAPVIALVLLLFHPGITRSAAAAPTCQGAGIQPERVAIQRLLPDDGDPASLQRLLQAVRRALARTGTREEIPPCWRSLLPAGSLATAAARLARILDEPADFPSLRQRLAAAFRLYRLPVPLLVTGYYEPELAGSLHRTGRFRHPIHRRPADLVTGRNGRAWRRDGRFLRPYWTRRQIEEDDVLAGQELVWVDDPVAAFFLHVQGSGRIRLPDGRVRRLVYAGSNGRPYTSIGRILAEQGVFDLEEITLPRIRRYLERHPRRLAGLLARNERYVFFRWRQQGGIDHEAGLALPPGDHIQQGDGQADSGPPGSLGVPLVAGRSLAADPAWFPAGALAYLVTSRPRFTGRGLRWLPSHRFVAILDRGAAIRGPGRLDLFFGHGPYAEKAAGAMRATVELYILVPR